MLINRNRQTSQNEAFSKVLYCNLWIRLRKIVIYLVDRKFYLRRFFALNVDGSDGNPEICLITPGCFNILTSHGFENFCLFLSNSTYSVQNEVINVQYVYN